MISLMTFSNHFKPSMNHKSCSPKQRADRGLRIGTMTMIGKMVPILSILYFHFLCGNCMALAKEPWTGPQQGSSGVPSSLLQNNHARINTNNIASSAPYTGDPLRRVVASYKEPGYTEADLAQVRANVGAGLRGLKVLPLTRMVVAYCVTIADQELSIEESYRYSVTRVAMMDVEMHALDAHGFLKGHAHDLSQRYGDNSPNKKFLSKRAPAPKDERKLQDTNETASAPNKNIPDDPAFDQLWGLHQPSSPTNEDIDAPEAWALYESDHAHESEQVIVAVIDTGIDYTHPDLAGRMWINVNEIPNNGIDDDLNGWIDDVHGIDLVNSDGDPMDDSGHGTHCAGTIGAIENDQFGVAGVVAYTRNVKLMGIKFLSAQGYGSLSNAAEGLEYAINMGARISSNSWGGGYVGGPGSERYNAFMGLLDSSKEQNHLFVASAGNSAQNIDGAGRATCTFPAENLVCVASTKSDGSLSHFSNYGVAEVLVRMLLEFFRRAIVRGDKKSR